MDRDWICRSSSRGARRPWQRAAAACDRAKPIRVAAVLSAALLLVATTHLLSACPGKLPPVGLDSVALFKRHFSPPAPAAASPNATASPAANASSDAPTSPAAGKSRLAIFYHAFLGSPDVADLSGKDVSDLVKGFDPMSVVNEQLLAIANSTLASAHMYTVTVGRTNASLRCGERCTSLHRASRGGEVLTHRMVWDYCRAHPSDSVLYMHNKGSFHPTRENVRLRRFITKSLLHPSGCAAMPPWCNVCSARFSPLPHFHTSGNMWIAQCRYVARLLDPRLFRLAMAGVVRPPRGMEESRFGTGRFAAEHWVHSHPAVVPCDVLPGNFNWGYTDMPDDGHMWAPKLQRAPRFRSIRNYWALGERYSHPWFSLWGRLYEWRLLYNEDPPADSWIWTYYTGSNNWGAIGHDCGLDGSSPLDLEALAACELPRPPNPADAVGNIVA